MRILLVEDTPRVLEALSSLLRKAGHQVVATSTRKSADEALAEGHHDLAIIDVALPDGSGLDVCRAARARGNDVPVLLLTAHTSVADRVAGLDAGADDYLGKPFAPEELTARVRALGRRGPRLAEAVRECAELSIDRERRMVLLRGARVPLTARELDIVVLLAWRDGRVVSRDDILESVWGETSEGAAASLEVLIARIRRKLDTPGAVPCIRTVRQMGYAWQLGHSKVV